MLSPEVLSLITASLLVSGVVILLFKARTRRPRRAQTGATPFFRLDDESEIHSAYESDSALSSLENLELVSENQPSILLSASMTGFLPTIVRRAPVAVEEVEETEDAEAFDSFGDDICDELEELVIEWESEEADEVIEEVASVVEEIEAESATVAAEEEKEELMESLPEEEIVSEAIIASEEAVEAPAMTAEEEEANLMAEISATADAIDTEIAELAASDADVRRATLRRAPRRQRRIVRAVDENIDTQISELDQRLDALEALVVSIELGLAEFEPLLEDVDAEAALAAAATSSEVANHGDDDHAQAA